jgi:bisphosphoglycerate-independent phosphoglycerate mutase (AlkP superfamily)
MLAYNSVCELSGLQLMDMAPTILQQLDVPIPTDMQGTSF